MNSSVATEVVRALKLAVFRRDASGRLRLHPPVPDWLTALWPAAAAAGESAHGVSPFLDNFLIDAAVYWESGSGPGVGSGPWLETDGRGGEHHLQGRALTSGRHALLLVEELGPAFDERRGILQKAHEVALDYERLQRAEQALAEEKRLLEQRVQDRTAELSRANLDLKSEVATRQRYAEQLRALSLRLVEVQEAERQFLARELHDEIGQLLTGLKLSLEIFLRSAPATGAPSCLEVLEVLDELMQRVRQLSLDLRPHLLDDFGLVPALEWHFKRFFKQTGIRVHFRHAARQTPVSPQLTTAIFRVVQEALTNVARHARVPEATVRLWTAGDWLGAQIEDHGRGFDPEAALAAHASSGLFGMKERAELLGGQFTLDSAPGSGTRLTVEVPVAGTLSVPAALHTQEDSP
ncbi:MAG: ATP-binding protein [Verrucomicrobia bacterium]|nr:ATP-binding protein [Verrucomicrobiota bacterium]